ncbi:MAG TPA: DUF2267 domain-containing protein [Jatrophihabitans sp.]|nr:DUF2267 domain-containing protein [Jatrophihabitans sp.]
MKRMKEHEIIAAVRRTAGLSDPESAKRAVKATLSVLGRRLAGGEPKDLASQLPPAIAEALPREGPGERFGIEEFYRRVAEAEGVPIETAREHAQAVAAVLKDAVTEGELDDVLAQLPAEYEELFGVSGRVRH